MKDKTELYQIENEFDLSQLDSENIKFDISQVNQKSLELVSQLLSFLYKVDKEMAEPKRD